jgi:hypothetical protein
MRLILSIRGHEEHHDGVRNSKRFVYYNERHRNSFERNFLENYNASEDAVKTKNDSFFMNFPNFNKNGATFFPLDWSFNRYSYPDRIRFSCLFPPLIRDNNIPEKLTHKTMGFGG